MSEPVRNWLAEQNLLVREEFPTPSGICDMIGVSLLKKKVGQRKRLNQLKSIGSLSRVRLLCAIPDITDETSITRKRLQRQFDRFYSNTRLESDIEYLQKNRFIVSSRKNQFQKVNGWMPLHKRIVAVELKLSRIEEVLFQARNHSSFATETYAALPYEAAQRVIHSRRKTDFQESGVGILGVKVEECEILLSSSLDNTYLNREYQIYCIEGFWRRVLQAV